MGDWGTHAIGYATSTDGIHWTKYGPPVYGLGGSGISGEAALPAVVKHDSTYYLYVINEETMSLATSSDGVVWTPLGMHISLPDGCDSWGGRSVWTENGVWRMLAVAWHQGLWDTYLYHSREGLSWTIDNGGQPLASLRLDPAGSYSGASIASVNGVAMPWFDGAYHLWYAPVDGPGYLPTDIYHATSANLADWRVTPSSPVLTHQGGGFEIDQVAFPSVVVADGTAYLYYNGSDNEAGAASIGVATAPATIASPAAGGTAVAPPPSAAPPDPFLGHLVVTVSDGLRVRSEPRVADDSIKYEPLLPLGTKLRVSRGPVSGSGYTWYYVEPVSQPLARTLSGGWVAIASKSGEAWLALAERPLEAYGTATIDGVNGAGEWEDAARINFRLKLPAHDGGGTVPATIYVMNDASNLYVAVEAAGAYSAFNPAFSFDNDNDGLWPELGDDVFLASSGNSRTPGPQQLWDDFEAYCTDSSLCGLEDSHAATGAAAPGTIDGEAAGFSDDVSDMSFIEMAHPLDSNDDAHDFSLRTGSVVGFFVDMRVISSSVTPECGYPACYGDMRIPTTGFTDIRIAAAQ